MNRPYGGIILAGGKGTRLMPLTARTPKPLLPLGKTTPLSLAIDSLCNAGINSIAITTGYLGEEIENYHFDNQCKITFLRENVPLGTAGMVLKNLSFTTDDFFVVSADCVFDFSLSEMMNFHIERNSAVTIATVSSANPTSYGTIMSKDGKILAFREKPSWKQTLSTNVNAGIYIIKRSVLENVKKNFTDFASEIFPFLLSRGENLSAFPINGYWCDMGTHQSYYDSNMHFSKGENIMGDYVSISKASSISQSLIMNGVRVGDKTVICRSVIGEGVSIGKNCVLEDAVIGPNALICDNVTVKKGSIIAENSILSKGKVFNKSFLHPPSFYDSGKIIINNDTAKILGKAISSILGNKDIYIFHNAYESNSWELCEMIYEGCIENEGNAFPPRPSLLPISAFVAVEKNSYSVFVEENKTGGFIANIFDPNGLSLSREEQLEIEKFVDKPMDKTTSNRSNIRHNAQFFNSSKEKSDIFSTDTPTPAYIKKKISIFPTISGENVNLLSNNLPSEICKEILTGLGARVETDKNNCGFQISDNGIEVKYITQSGETIDKMRLFAIGASFFAQDNIPLPDFIPEGVKNAIITKGSFILYSDSILGRGKDNGIISFYDGVSIVLSVVSACFLSKSSVYEINKTLPPFAFAEKTVLFNGNKGKAVEALLASSEENAPSGISFLNKDGKTLIVPDYGNSFRIFAEALSAEVANELILKAEENLSSVTE